MELNEKTLNAYIQRAINEEVDELFGSRVRKQNARMITGKGWGNQKRSQGNFWGAANTDIQDSDADEVVPQTLVGMIKKMEQGIMEIEKVAGLPGKYEGLADTVAAYRNGGGIKMKQSLLNAINALSRLADRTNAIERKSGSNAIMESAGDYMDAAAAGNAVAGNINNMNQIKKAADIAAKNAQYLQGKGFQLIDGEWFYNGIKNPQNNALVSFADDVKKAANAYADNAGIAKSSGAGFWGKQLANMKNGAQMFKSAGQAGKQATQAALNAGKTARAAKMAGAAKTISQGATAIGRLSQIPMLLFSIADEAARQAAQARQKKIVRTYNCAAVLARRIGNIAQEIEKAQEQQQQETPDALEEQRINEINVKKSRSYFDSIEAGMSKLSAIMQQIGAKLKSGQEQQEMQMPKSLNTPQEIAQFQEWANNAGYRDSRGRELAVDGKWGPNTEYVYNLIEQGTQDALEEGRNGLNESRAVMRALDNLEAKVGETGAGGKAYANISAMSGARDGSRGQGAVAAKQIIRSYPPVLNQYLAVLSDAGADVSSIRPLDVDDRPNRDYDVVELQEIDKRIKLLLGIAQNMGDIAPQQQNVQLPPKPVRQATQPKQGGQKAAENEPSVPEMPEIDTSVKIEDPEIESPEEAFQELKNDDQQIRQIAYKDPRAKQEQIQKDRNFVDNVIDVMRRIVSENSGSLKVRRKNLNSAYWNALLAIDRLVEWGAMTPKEARAEKKRLKDFYKQFKNGGKDALFGDNWEDVYTPTQPKQEQPAAQTVSEQAFKKLVKQVIRENFLK